MISCIKCMTHGVLAVCKSVSCSTDGTVEHNSSHSTQHRLSEITYNRQIEVQGCWCSANATVSGTIPTYGSDIGRIPTEARISKRDWKTQKHACDWVPRCAREKNRLKMWKKRLKRKKQQEFRWGCVLETFKTYPAGAFRQRLREYVSNWTGLTNKVMISFPFTARGLDGFFHYTFFRSQQMFTFDASFLWALIHSNPWDQLQVPRHATYQSLVTYDVLPHSPVDICKKN